MPNFQSEDIQVDQFGCISYISVIYVLCKSLTEYINSDRFFLHSK